MSCSLSKQTKASSQDSLALSHADQLGLPLPASCQLCSSCSLPPSRRFSCSLTKNLEPLQEQYFFQYFAGLEITFGKNTVYLS